MKLARLWQPGRLLFWMMLAFQALGALCSHALRTLPLNTLGMLLLAGAALLNMACGLWAAWRLLHEPPPGPTADPTADPTPQQRLKP